MKNRKWMWIALLILIVTVATVTASSAAAGTPGSQADPVVTKSYVDKTVKEEASLAAKAAAEEAAAIAAKAAVESEIETLTEKIAEGLSTGTGAGSYVVVNVPAGKSMIGKAGTEIIVRAGVAKAIDNGADGLSDVTAGTDIKGGVTAETNHLLLCPRDDGRGLYAASELWVMVRGEYTLW